MRGVGGIGIERLTLPGRCRGDVLVGSKVEDLVGFGDS